MKLLLSALCLTGVVLTSCAAVLPLDFQQIEPGVVYAHQVVQPAPWSIHILKIDRRRSDLKFVTTLGKEKIHGLSPLPEQVDSITPRRGKAVAAINGDFFLIAKKPYQGDPRGLQIMNGELVSAPGKDVCFWLDGATPRIEQVVSKFHVTWPNGKDSPLGLNEERAENQAVLLTPTLGDSTRTTNGLELVLERAGAAWLPLRAQTSYSARVRTVSGTNTATAPGTMVLSIGPKLVEQLPPFESGMKLKISTDTSAAHLDKAETAIGGGPALVHLGKTLIGTGVAPSRVSDAVRHPRTALGWNDAFFFFVVVDGRRENVSVGMTFAELADEMAALGCQEAMNLDGADPQPSGPRERC